MSLNLIVYSYGMFIEIRTEAVMQALAMNKKQSMAPMSSKRTSAVYSPLRRTADAGGGRPAGVSVLAGGHASGKLSKLIHNFKLSPQMDAQYNMCPVLPLDLQFVLS